MKLNQRCGERESECGCDCENVVKLNRWKSIERTEQKEIMQIESHEN